MNWFKNLKIRTRLILSFSIVIAFCLVMAVVAIVAVSNLDNSYTYLLEYPQTRLEVLLQANVECAIMRRFTAMFALNAANPAQVESFYGQFNDSYNRTVNQMNAYITNSENDTVRDPARLKSNRAKAEEVLKELASYKENVEKARQTALDTGHPQSVNDVLLESSAIITAADDGISELVEISKSTTQEISDANTVERNMWTYIIIALISVVFVLSMAIAVLVAQQISTPMATLTSFMKKAGTTGDITLRPEDVENIGKLSQYKDELGVCIASAASFVGRVTEISDKLGVVAAGDLRVEVELLSKDDVMGISLNTMMGNLNQMFGELRTASNQVSAGAGQVSQAAQSLASGSSEQAAGIEEFTSTLAEMQVKTKENADNSVKAREANSKAGSRLGQSISSMSEMLEAMRAIDESSANITKVIKVIDDIAFQTNILALNAAVEAARAGQHGKGFAVVAEEVRNLASKSAAAAKETATLIEGSSARVREGNEIVAKTNADLEAAAQDSQESTRLIEQVAAASSAQAGAITEINRGIEQISTVVQANSATAEQSAAAAQQMSAQSIVMNDIVDRFKLKQADEQITFSQRPAIAPHERRASAAIGGKY